MYAGARRTVTIQVDGVPISVETRALTVGWALRDANLALSPLDRLWPPAGQPLGWAGQIWLERAVQVQIWQPGKGLSRSFLSIERRPANLLSHEGIRLFPGDRLLWNGQPLDIANRMPPAPAYLIQYVPAQAVVLRLDGQIRPVTSSAPTLGSLLWELGLRLGPQDWVSLPLESGLEQARVVDVRRARSIQIQVDGKSLQSRSAALSVGGALAEAGVSLQNLDYSTPAEDKPLPANGNIRVVRVREEITLTQTPLPFKTEYVADAKTELDQQSIVQAGRYGIQVSRKRVRYEDGKEVARTTDAAWTASQPVNQKVGYGTKVVVRTLQTEAGTLQYWRALNVYATSYSPCGLGNVAKCYYGTSLGLPVKRGVIAVTNHWYHVMAGQSVYVPNYGRAVIADIGAGIPGRAWIDLGFTDADLELWHQNVTLYFLTPVPANIPWILP